MLRTLSKSDQVRIYLTTNDRISNKLPNKIRMSAVAPRSNNLEFIYFLSAICSKRMARNDANGSAQSTALSQAPSRTYAFIRACLIFHCIQFRPFLSARDRISPPKRAMNFSASAASAKQ
jgi:hypothetical protein